VEGAPGRPLVHPLSAGLLIAIDALWTLADWAAFAWIVTIPLSFAAVFIPGYLVQRHLNHNTRGASCAVAAVLGVLAAIPTPVTGTITGTLILALAGIRSLRR
jgi:hypothetical protein